MAGFRPVSGSQPGAAPQPSNFVSASWCSFFSGTLNPFRPLNLGGGFSSQKEGRSETSTHLPVLALPAPSLSFSTSPSFHQHQHATSSRRHRSTALIHGSLCLTGKT